MVCVPVPICVGVYATWQLAEASVPDRVHEAAGLNVPVLVLAKLTIPVGVMAVPVEVSVIVAVQVVGALTTTELGLQTTAVVVLRFPTVRLKVPELPLWVGSPA